MTAPTDIWFTELCGKPHKNSFTGFAQRHKILAATKAPSSPPGRTRVLAHHTIVRQVGEIPRPARTQCGEHLFEVSVIQSLEAAAVSCFVLSHFVNGVVNCVIAQLLSLFSQLELALAGAVLSHVSQLQVLLG